MIAWYHRMRSLTVFREIPFPPKHPNQILAAYFHRTAFTLYLIYFCWGLASIPGTVAVLQDTAPDDIQTWMSFIVLPLAAVSAIGALFFPRTGRLELYGASALSVVILLYLFFYLLRAINGSETAWVGLILSTQYLVVPVSRVVFIFNTLIRTAKQDGEAEAAQEGLEGED